jgi:hypothetical protein
MNTGVSHRIDTEVDDSGMERELSTKIEFPQNGKGWIVERQNYYKSNEIVLLFWTYFFRNHHKVSFASNIK